MSGATGTVSSAGDFLALKGKRRFMPVEGLSELGLSARMRSLSELERSRYESQFLDRKTGSVIVDRLKQAKVELMVLCLVDDAGEVIFSGEHVPGLLDIDSAIVNRIYDQIRAFVGFDKGDVEKLAGN